MLRIALVIEGDATDPGTWSGVTTGLASGFEAAGTEIVPIDATFPASGKIARALRMSWVDQSTSPAFAAACGRAADRRLRAAGQIDGVVMIGSGYSLSIEAPIVTYEDMTVAQALAGDDQTYDGVSERAGRRWRERQRRNYERARGCCVASAWAGRSIRDDYGIDAAKIHAVGFGRNKEPQQVDRDWQTPHFIFVGGDWQRKCGATVVEAFARVHERHPDATLELVGDHPPIEQAGVTGHGRLPLGTEAGRKQYSNILARATCLVLPSAYEPFGISYLDSGATGVPSIGTTVGGAADAIGEGGRVVDPFDVEALTAAMLELADPAKARRLGELAFARTDLFSWQAVAERMIRALRPPGVDVSKLADFLTPAKAAP